MSLQQMPPKDTRQSACAQRGSVHAATYLNKKSTDSAFDNFITFIQKQNFIEPIRTRARKFAVVEHPAGRLMPLPHVG